MNELLLQHLALVQKANETTNITRISTFEEGVLLHIEDSLSGLAEVQAAPDGLLVDLGSGAGFPGIPLAIETGRKSLLVESIGKKAHLLEEFVRQLSLEDQVQVYAGRAEELAQEEPGIAAVVTARAVSKLGSLMELASPLLTRGGQLVCYKAQVDSEEAAVAKAIQSTVGMRLCNVREFSLSDGETKRSIWVFQKVAEPAIRLPRHVGMAQKKPLKK